MVMEPARPREIVPYEVPRSVRRELEREAATLVYRVRLEDMIKALRLSNAHELAKMQIDLDVSLGNEIVRNLESNDNPLVHLALKRRFEEWLTRSASIVSGY